MPVSVRPTSASTLGSERKTLDFATTSWFSFMPRLLSELRCTFAMSTVTPPSPHSPSATGGTAYTRTHRNAWRPISFFSRKSIALMAKRSICLRDTTPSRPLVALSTARTRRNSLSTQMGRTRLTSNLIAGSMPRNTAGTPAITTFMRLAVPTIRTRPKVYCRKT